MLLAMDLLEDEVMLLLSHQISQICEDMYEVRQLAAHLDSGESAGWTAARYAYSSLRALAVMEGYSKLKFKKHPSISSTFVRFLTRMISQARASTAVTKLRKFEDSVSKLHDKFNGSCATPASVQNLDTKLEKIISLNDLKKK